MPNPDYRNIFNFVNENDTWPLKFNDFAPEAPWSRYGQDLIITMETVPGSGDNALDPHLMPTYLEFIESLDDSSSWDDLQ